MQNYQKITNVASEVELGLEKKSEMTVIQIVKQLSSVISIVYMKNSIRMKFT